MLKKNKGKVILSSVILLLPMLWGSIRWNALPDVMTTHWGADGNADGFGTKAFAVFGLPVILLALHFVCLLLTLSDKRQQEQNQKALGIVFWLVPVISLFTSGVMYGTALGRESSVASLAPVLFGLLFLIMGNYLPKVKQNATLGIKVWWALRNEENWNRTHRFGGKVWVIGGMLLLISAFLPFAAARWVLPVVIAASVISPMLYSYCIYRQHRKKGIVYAVPPESKAEGRRVKRSAACAVIIPVAAAVLLLTGNIEVSTAEESFCVHATYWTDLEIRYCDIDTAAYRSDVDVGVRTNGFGSARLSLGAFRNEEFGAYTLYAYTGAKEFVVLTSEGKTLVIGLRDAKDTQALYDTVSSKIT